MIKYSFSNIGLSAIEHASELADLAEAGLHGVEVAPSRVWHDTWKGLKNLDVLSYRRQIEFAGLNVVGLHSLFFDQPNARMFGSPDSRKNALEFLVHLSGVCRDLGGRTLIFGGGRHRGKISLIEANRIAVDFVLEYIDRTADHGTCLCFEPLGPVDADFINSAYDALALVKTVNHPAFCIQLDAKALVNTNELRPEVFDDCAKHLVHFHANEPGLTVVGSSGLVDHAFMGEQLNRIGYKGYVSIEQRMLREDDPVSDIVASAYAVRQAYGRRAHCPNEREK